MASDGASSRVGDAEDSLEKINWLWVLVGICFRVQCSETVVAWTCSWDLNSSHYMYAELQNGSILMFEMARELKMPALLSETSMSNKPLKRNMFTHLAAMLLLSQPLCPGQLQNSLFYHIWMSSTLSPRDDHIDGIEEKMEKQLQEVLQQLRNLTKNQSVKTMKSNKCKLIHWFSLGEVVAEGTRISSDPKELVHHALLGPGAAKVSVDVMKKPEAFLWRPNVEMATIDEALSSYVT